MMAKWATLNDWFTMKKKSSRKSSVEFEAGDGDKEMEANQRALSAVASIFLVMSVNLTNIVQLKLLWNQLYLTD